MAFSAHTLSLVIGMAQKREKPVRIACLGYPDMLLTPEVIRKVLKLDADAAIPWREDSEAIIAWHGLQNNKLPGIVDATWLLEGLGFWPTYLDIAQPRGVEEICDLNEPIGEDLKAQFDIVYDAGTMEHCFNVGQAVKNILAMTKVGGFIYHGNPHNAGNHGFYNFCPTFYHDFYTQNGHELVPPGCAILLNGNVKGVLPSVGRYHLTFQHETWIEAIVEKKHNGPPKWPMQTKYIENPNLSGGVR